MCWMSYDDVIISDDYADRNRARAMAIVSLTKASESSCDIIRIQRGKPLPGSLRPEPKSKRSKAKPMTFVEEMPTFSETAPE